MGGKEGLFGRFLVTFANKIHQHIDCKLFSSAVTLFAGFAYGDITGGTVKDWEAKQEVVLVRKDFERQMREYEAEARQVMAMASWEAANAN